MSLALTLTPGVPVLPAGTTDKQLPGILGLDVSEFQELRSPIDWDRLMGVRQWGGVRFVIARAAKRLVRDPTHASHLMEALDRGLAVGSYHRVNPNADMLDQAKLFMDTLGRPGPGQLPPVLDAEDGEPTSAQLLTWLHHVWEASGLCPWIYTSPGFWVGKFAHDQEFARFPLWEAHWSALQPLRCPPWSDHICWQFSNRGRIGGITGAVDLDVFNGDEDSLRRLARMES